MDSFDRKIRADLQPLIDGLLAGELPRRDFLRRAVGLGLKSSAAYALLNQSMADAQGGRSYTTMAIVNGRPEEEAAPAQPKPGTPTTLRAEVPGQQPEEEQASTRAVGEENRTTYRVGEEEQATTQALGEENATTRRAGEENVTTTAIINGRPEEDQVSTRAVGEEARTTHGVGEEDQASTRAMGEESVTTQRVGEENNYTTHGVGEEDKPATQKTGEGSPTTLMMRNGRPEEDQATTRALGEENRNPRTTLGVGEEGANVPPSNQLQLGPGEYIVNPPPPLGPGEYIVPTPARPQPVWDGFRRWPNK